MKPPAAGCWRASPEGRGWGLHSNRAWHSVGMGYGCQQPVGMRLARWTHVPALHSSAQGWRQQLELQSGCWVALQLTGTKPCQAEGGEARPSGHPGAAAQCCSMHLHTAWGRHMGSKAHQGSHWHWHWGCPQGWGSCWGQRSQKGCCWGWWLQRGNAGSGRDLHAALPVGQ